MMPASLLFAFAAAVLAQDGPEGFEISAQYRAGSGLGGVASFAGAARLPDGAILQLTLIRMGYTAGVMSAKLTHSPTSLAQGFKVEVRNSRFAVDLALPTCGDYRLQVGFLKRHQERLKIHDAVAAGKLAEFETRHDFSFGTDTQVFAALRHALKETDASRQRIEGALGTVSDRGTAEVSGRLQRIKAELIEATPRMVLVASLLAQIDTCGLFYNQLAFESRVPEYRVESTGGGVPGGEMVQVDKKEGEAGQGASAPGSSAPSKTASRPIDLSNLDRISNRETALILTALFRTILGGSAPDDIADDRKLGALVARVQPLLAFHLSLAESRPRYKELSASGALSLESLLHDTLALLEEHDPEKRKSRFSRIPAEAEKLSDALAVIR
jgi:hypothetical protein